MLAPSSTRSASSPRLVGDFTESEHVEHRAYCKLHLGPFLTQSPFLRRALEKPLGYAGDYEMMNMLYRDPAEGDTLFGRALNCVSPTSRAQANKNRIDYIGRLIWQRRRAPGPADPDREPRLRPGARD